MFNAEDFSNKTLVAIQGSDQEGTQTVVIISLLVTCIAAVVLMGVTFVLIAREMRRAGKTGAGSAQAKDGAGAVHV
ncbi:hypothetical protein UVI_02020860 [Ustilaginoidea virens]|nr:hypothetical protein UVI_02020860 [Ustilaginoidea virens]